MASAPSQTLWSSQDHTKELPCSNSHAHWKGTSTRQTITNVRNIVECKVISRTKGGKFFSYHTRSARGGKSWKPLNLQSSSPSNSSKLKSRRSNFSSNSWARLPSCPHFPSSTPIKPRSGCRHPSLHLKYPWSWLAVGNGLPCNDFVWPIVPPMCSLLSLTVLK